MPCLCGDSECPSCGLAQGTLQLNALLDTVEWTAQPKPGESIDLPWATHTGVLSIGGIELECAVLSDGQRVFTGELIEEMVEGVRALLGLVDEV